MRRGFAREKIYEDDIENSKGVLLIHVVIPGRADFYH
jgi:hypothetical protein